MNLKMFYTIVRNKQLSHVENSAAGILSDRQVN